MVDPKPGQATPGGGFAVLTMQGLEPDHMTETFYARMPTPDELTQLELPAGEPVMVLHRTTCVCDRGWGTVGAHDHEHRPQRWRLGSPNRQDAHRARSTSHTAYPSSA